VRGGHVGRHGVGVADEDVVLAVFVVEGTLYPLLTRLKNAGLLAYQWKESTSGPPRKYYVLTEGGKRFLEETVKAWRELQTMINKLI